jgi:phosphate transport system ATP-binding protein
MQQAARISDLTGFLYLGKLIEYGPTQQIFSNPHNELTERYISGKFG